MADYNVLIIMEKLKQLLENDGELIHEVRGDVEFIYNKFGMLKEFLKDICQSPSFTGKKEIVEHFTCLTRNVAYQAEDVIDIFVIRAVMQKAREDKKSSFRHFDYPSMIRGVVEEIESIARNMTECRDKEISRFENPVLGNSPYIRDPIIIEEDTVVGFHTETRMLVDRLITGQRKDLDTLSIIGMGGLGKTTLARQIFTDSKVENEFCNRAWIHVSQALTRKDVFLSILCSFTQLTEEMLKMNDERLAAELRRHIQSGKYLIVLDDVWTAEAWDHLKTALPNNKNGSRIMLTSQNKEVAVHANPSFVHHLRFLTDEESWELLKKRVFRRESCPSELEDLGRQIATECEGLPLAIVFIAGLLTKGGETRDWWQTVAESVREYVARYPQRCMDMLAFGYNHLPYHLKACFLYFGIFPKDYEVPVWILIRIWIAEGHIQQIGREDLEDIAEGYLQDLVGRNLVLVERRRYSGRIKTCRIHTIVREMCLNEAEKENFLLKLKSGMPIPVNPTKNEPLRLCIHSDVNHYFSLIRPGHYLRSLLCFDSQKREFPLPNLSFISYGYKFVRVLDIRSIRFPTFPNDIVQLIHLRYIAISGDFEILPASVAKLWYTQTIIVETSSRTLTIQADIRKMFHLRHLHINVPSHFQETLAKERKINKNSNVRINIQTMSIISPESCTDNVLAGNPNLKKLGIGGKLLTLVEVKGGSSLFDNLKQLDSVETMKLLNDTYPLPPPNGKLPGLPQAFRFPPNLKKLTLSDTLLDWKHMSTLALLKNLEVLKLKDNAFTGWLWETDDGGFCQLRALILVEMDLGKWIVAFDNHFPRLERLVVERCQRLEEIPSTLANVTTLQTMELYWPAPALATSARKIQQQRHEMQLQQSSVNSGLELKVHPSDF